MEDRHLGAASWEALQASSQVVSEVHSAGSEAVAKELERWAMGELGRQETHMRRLPQSGPWARLGVTSSHTSLPIPPAAEDLLTRTNGHLDRTIVLRTQTAGPGARASTLVVME